jgi:hypothetical protein
VKAEVNLSAAVKEAVGNTLALQLFTADGAFVSGINWASYGGPYDAHLPDGTAVHDPDPAVIVNIANLGGQDVFLVYQAHGFNQAGATLWGLK